MALILASQSPRRRALLMQVTSLPFETVHPEADETLSPRWTPRQAVERLSRRKAQSVEAAPGDVVISADTLVCLGRTLLGKPETPEDACAMLRRLSGRRHKVYTGVTVRRDTEYITACAVTSVHFRTLAPEEIRRYVASGEPMDKAGSYGISGQGALFVSSVRGDYYTVVGLPLCLTARLLRRFDVVL